MLYNPFNFQSNDNWDTDGLYWYNEFYTKKPVWTGLNQFHGLQKTGPRWSGSVPAISGSVLDQLRSTVARFGGKKPDWTGLTNTTCKVWSSMWLVHSHIGSGIYHNFSLLLSCPHFFWCSWNVLFTHPYNLVMSRTSLTISGDPRSWVTTLVWSISTTRNGKKSWMHVTLIVFPRMRTTLLTSPSLTLTVQFYLISAAPKRLEYIFAYIPILNLPSI